MTTLLVGFDSAWTAANQGALIGVLWSDDGTIQELDTPQPASYREAQRMIRDWQRRHDPDMTVVLLDQPTIVNNERGQRPVENIISPAVGRRYGGIQPANTSRKSMFGKDAPVWRFLGEFGGPANPFGLAPGTQVLETYPTLALIALGWTLPDRRPCGRLPKYNPERRRTFVLSNWEHVCRQVSEALRVRALTRTVEWLDRIARAHAPSKVDQDRLDSCICLLVALYIVETRDCLMVGTLGEGYIIVPYRAELAEELEARCRATGRSTEEWVCPLRLSAPAGPFRRIAPDPTR